MAGSLKALHNVRHMLKYCLIFRYLFIIYTVMENPDPIDPKGLELALMESKETVLNGVADRGSNKSSVDRGNDANLTTDEVCDVCGKMFPRSLTENDNSRGALCESCPEGKTSSKFAKDELDDSLNKRDSGFHTLNRGNKEHLIDTGQQPSESGISSTSSAESEMSIGGNMTVDATSIDTVAGDDASKVSSSIMVDECNNMADGKNNSCHNASCSDSDTSRENGKLCHTSQNQKEPPENLAKKLFSFDGYKRTEVAGIIGKRYVLNICNSWSSM